MTEEGDEHVVHVGNLFRKGVYLYIHIKETILETCDLCR